MLATKVNSIAFLILETKFRLNRLMTLTLLINYSHFIIGHEKLINWWP